MGIQECTGVDMVNMKMCYGWILSIGNHWADMGCPGDRYRSGVCTWWIWDQKYLLDGHGYRWILWGRYRPHGCTVVYGYMGTGRCKLVHIIIIIIVNLYSAYYMFIT